MRTILLISPYWKEPHRWMVSSYKLAELWQRLGYRVVVACMGDDSKFEIRNSKLETRLPSVALAKAGHSPAHRSFSEGGTLGYEDLSPTLRIYRKQDVFLKDPWNYGIAFGFTSLVRRIIREEKPDLIVCNKVLFWTSLSVILLKWSGYKVLLLTDALVGITWWPRGTIPQICAAIYARTLGWLVLKSARRIVFFHPQPPHVLKRLGIASKSQVIPTGIDPTSYEGDRPARHPEVTVTYVGRLESVKGVDDFLAAMQPLMGQYPYLKVQVVGWYKERHPLVSQYPEVTFLGLRKDIPEILKASEIFVLPSHSEGLSNALMEAMSSGCACIASDVGGNAYLIQNGISGFLFPAGDREALRAHVERLLKDPSKVRAMGQAARERIKTVFSWEVVGREYAALFAELEKNHS
jgi:glycosyltransferase involved in cell wall biosynthesis